MEFYAGQAVWNFNSYIWLFVCEVSPENTPKGDSALMLAPRNMINFTESCCNCRSVARPCCTDNLIVIIAHFGFLLIFGGGVRNWLFSLLLVSVKVIIKIVIILVATVVSSVFLFGLFHLLKSFLGGVVSIYEIEIGNKLMDQLGFFNSIILPDDIVVVKSMRLGILIKDLSQFWVYFREKLIEPCDLKLIQIFLKNSVWIVLVIIFIILKIVSYELFSLSGYFSLSLLGGGAHFFVSGMDVPIEYLSENSNVSALLRLALGLSATLSRPNLVYKRLV